MDTKKEIKSNMAAEKFDDFFDVKYVKFILMRL